MCISIKTYAKAEMGRTEGSKWNIKYGYSPYSTLFSAGRKNL
jgi:hypothetical protein